MGKTHLMHAIGHTIKKRNPAMRLRLRERRKIYHLKSSTPCASDRMISFRDRFHTVDVLLGDDIQFYRR